MIGREREIELLREHLGPGRVVALVGPSGVGKTAIAEEAARRIGDTTLMVDCFKLDPTNAAVAVAEAAELDLELSRTNDLWARAAEALKDIDVVVLDDVGFDLAELHTFRSNFGGALLITCHAADGDVARLPITGFDVGELGGFSTSSACELFVEAARRANLKFELADDDIERVREIARRVDGYPLALSLAGRRAGSTSVETVLELLEDPKTLTDPTRTERHRTLHTALKFSWDELESADQRRMYVMALFSRPLRPRMLAALLGEPLEELLDGLDRLVGRGLVASGRFPRPLEAFVDLAVEQFEAGSPDEADELRRRIARHAADAAAHVPRGLDEHVDFAGEEPSLWQFVITHPAHGLADADVSACVAAWVRWATLRGLTFERLSLPVEVESLIASLDDWNVWVAAARHRIVDPEESLKLVDRAVASAATDGERLQAHLLRGYLFVQLGDLAAASAAFDAARELGEFPSIGHVFEAEFHVMADDTARAQECLERAGEPDGLGVISRAYMQTLSAWLARTPTEALREQQKVVELCAASGQLRGEAAARQALATLLAQRFGRYDAALDELDRMQALAEKAGDARFAIRARASAVWVLVLQGDYEQASQIAEAVVGTGDPGVDDSCYLLWLIARWQLGDHEVVREEWAKKELTEPPAAIPPQDEAWAVFDVAMALDRGDDQVADLVEQHRRSMPQTAALFDAMLAVTKLNPASDFKKVLKAWQSVREVLLQRDGSLGVELCWRLLSASMPGEMHAFESLEQGEASVRVLADYEALFADGQWHDLSTQPLSQRLLQVLVEADEPLHHDAVGALLYPDEIVVEDAMKNRIDVQVSKLRKLGLRPYLAKRPEGFVLEGDVFVASR